MFLFLFPPPMLNDCRHRRGCHSRYYSDIGGSAPEVSRRRPNRHERQASRRSQNPASSTYTNPHSTSWRLSQTDNDDGHSYDGAASESTSEGLSEIRHGRADTANTLNRRESATESGANRRESRKPWEPPFPIRMRTTKEPAYRVLPSIRSTSDQESGEWVRKDKGKGKIWERRSTSQVAPEEEENDIAPMGHLPVTDLPSYSAPNVPSFMMPPPTPAQPSQKAAVNDSQDQGLPAHAAPEPTPTTAIRQQPFSFLQAILLLFAFIIFIFAFAILVAHCITWFVVYKTEARLGDVRRGLLKGGDMRICLCAR